MNRRAAIRNVIIISAGAGLLPSCMGGDNKPSMTLKNISLTRSQENMLAELAGAIIPKTNDFVGAKDLRSHEFVLTMVDDCTSPEDQQKFTEGLKEFDDECRKKSSSSFVKCTPAQRTEWLKQVENKQAVSPKAVDFYNITKRYTVQSFISSKEYMTGVRHYKMVPGPVYKGCVPVK